MAHTGLVFLGKKVGKFLGEVDVNGRHSSKLLDYIVYVNACSVSTPEIVTFLYSIRRNISSIKLYFRLKSSNGAVAWHECQRSCVVCFIVRWTVPLWISKLVRKMRIVFLISIMQIGKYCILCVILNRNISIRGTVTGRPASPVVPGM